MEELKSSADTFVVQPDTPIIETPRRTLYQGM
jgi:hypothetical protein